MKNYKERQSANEKIKQQISEISRSMDIVADNLYIEPGSSAQMAKSFESLKENLKRFSNATHEVSQNLTDEFKESK